MTETLNDSSQRDRLQRLTAEVVAENQGRPIDAKAVLIDCFTMTHNTGRPDPALPMGVADVVSTTADDLKGLADLLVFHDDGSASAIKTFDAACSFDKILAAISEAHSDGRRLALAYPAIQMFRPCLLWTSTGSKFLDVLVDVQCERAGVTSLPMAALRTIAAIPEATRRLLKESTTTRPETR